MGALSRACAGRSEPLARAGVAGFKAFLCHSGIDEFPNAGEADLRAAMPELARAGLPLLVHAELIGTGAAPAPASDRSKLAATPAISHRARESGSTRRSGS